MSGGWVAAALKGDEGEYMVRCRAALPGADERARYSVAIWIIWGWAPIASEAEEDAIIDEMIRFENAVHEAAERGGWGMLVAVVTNGAGREWLWHAANAQEFAGEMRGALEGHPDHPVEVRAFDDPTWKAARELDPRRAVH